MDDVITRKDVHENLKILKRQLSFLPLMRAIDFFGSLPAEILNTTRCTACRDDGQHRLLRIVSLSSCRQGLKPEIDKPVRIRND